MQQHRTRLVQILCKMFVLTSLIFLGDCTPVSNQADNEEIEPIKSPSITEDSDSELVPIYNLIDGKLGGQIVSGVVLDSLSSFLEKGVLKNGEGDFEVWYIKQTDGEQLGYLMEHPFQKGRVGRIFITSKEIVTEEGLHVGSTWADLLKVHPDIEVHGSEIEGRTAATFGSYRYQLDSRSYEYEIERSSILPQAKVELIWIQYQQSNKED